MIEAAGVSLLWLPRYSPGLDPPLATPPSYARRSLWLGSPIEAAFSKLEALLGKAAEQAIDGPWTTIGLLVDIVTPNECSNYFTAAGYDAS
jgi:hypothetical protein